MTGGLTKLISHFDKYMSPVSAIRYYQLISYNHSASDKWAHLKLSKSNWLIQAQRLPSSFSYFILALSFPLRSSRGRLFIVARRLQRGKNERNDFKANPKKSLVMAHNGSFIAFFNGKSIFCQRGGSLACFKTIRKVQG